MLQAWPTLGKITAIIGENPALINKGAQMATGTPKPPIPCRNEGNNQPKNIIVKE